MNSAAAMADQRNPFPGLRPFREDEEYLFFGRESQVDAMVDKLAATHFLAVVGTSGSGKSSLVNCGLRPVLHRGLMAHAGTTWRMTQFRPGSDPMRAMASALAEDGVLFRDYDVGGLSLTEIVDTTLRMSKLGLIDIYEQAQLGKDVNLLVVVDQFEELFRYRQLGAGRQESVYGVSEEATAFVNLLLEATDQETYPIYIVLTMRSDFLGDCAQFPGLAEAINAGQYLVPRMTRDERRAAISGPVGVGGAKISPVLLTRLVNDVGDNPDQLSILQHALNRTWARWQHDGGNGPIDLTNYQAIGTMAHALDQHAEQAYAQLETARQRKICEKLFKALTDKATDPRGVRRPTILGTLRALTHATETEVTGVIDIFRHPSRSFLMPPAGETLGEETVIDISHESLMRVWERLKAWTDEEAESARIYRRLAETSILHGVGRAGLWRDPDLQFALKWRDENRPNVDWAQRYHPDFESAMSFLKESKAARRRRRWKLAVITASVFAFFAGFLGIYLWMRYESKLELARKDAAALVQTIIKASPAELPNLIDRELKEHQHLHLAKSKLQKAAQNPASEKERLNASLALLAIGPVDHSQVADLSERLLDCDADEFGVIRQRLNSHKEGLLARLWQILHDAGQGSRKRFYAGMALAHYAPESNHWSDADYKFLTDQLVSSSADYQRSFRSYLTPIKQKLLKPLEDIFVDAVARNSLRVAAANALSDYAADAPQRMTLLACQATPEQYEIVYPRLEESATDIATVRSTLINVIAEQPEMSLAEAGRVRLGSRRAIAAITLIRLGDHEQGLKALSVGDDPESLTQFVHRAKNYGLRAADLPKYLQIAQQVKARYGILLALAEYELKDIPEEQHKPLVAMLALWYGEDPSSAIHGATGWLLRKWGMNQIVTQIDRTPHPYDPAREWFVIKINSSTKPGGRVDSDYFTFVVFEPAEFWMGSPEYEQGRRSDETLHRVQLNRRFAISDREVTRAQYERFVGRKIADLDEWSKSGRHPIVGVNWYQAVEYCRWLTDKAGMDKSKQSYTGSVNQQKTPVNWEFHPSRPGFRLPTDAEWEYACRSGTRTRFNFGSDERLLPNYSWYLGSALNSRSEATATRIPNGRGLFDMHGNAMEWCHDWYAPYSETGKPDPQGPDTGTRKILRGASWYDNARSVRSADRARYLPTDAMYSMGFRLSITIPGDELQDPARQ
ncbi:MAG: formylglycine-generating enzyme family protein [Planctomycetota bacterium]|jgi:formylglycine-generating enzyme required for sulfatase activity